MNLTLSFLSGILAAFSPCVIVLIPILLYRFFHENEKEWSKFSLFILGFLIFYLIFGYFLFQIFTSSIQNGIKFGIGLLFVVLGVLAVMNRLNPLNFPIIKNSFLLGSTFALIVSFNPCSIPYLSVILSLTSKPELFFNLMLFGLGTIIPSILFAIFGKNILNITKKTGKLFNKVNTVMHYILIVSGIYLISTINSLKINDLYLVIIFLVISFFILIKSFFIINQKKDILKLKNVLLLIGLISIIYVSFTHCSYQLESKNKIDAIFGIKDQTSIQNQTCGHNITDCKICTQCIYTFSLGSLIGFLGIFLLRLKQ